MIKILQVSELTQQIKNLLESHFTQLFVEGEVSRPTYHTSGHLYFSLKDDKSVIRVVMFRSDLANVPFRVEEGQKLIVGGRIGLYSPRGEYQLYAKELHPAGEGSLQIAFKQLKERLEKEGYFAKNRPIPDFVQTIAIVTSKTSAALQDMLRVANKRWPLVKIYVVNSLVQGKEAALELAEAIKIADSLGADVMIVGRGGGSLEDLWCFNEEIVAKAIFEAKTPVVSAVGHEIDYVISDFVADLRAPTPSAAMEMILPDRMEILQMLDILQERMHKRILSVLTLKEQDLLYMQRSLQQLSPQKKIALYLSQMQSLRATMQQAIHMQLSHKAQLLPQIKNSLQNSMQSILHKKYQELEHLHQKLQFAFESKKTPPAFAQVIKDGKPTSLENIAVGDTIELQDLSYRLTAQVKGKDAL